ncbi:hypothetical protein FFJ24_009245 [Pedobacter sp. KBS0701]|uniref:hypothetical protein n=1 Tax=Pedobacter sp. KBS0701 TaxID=2578106 RepID=UPI00110EF4F8|nr:hypothetical protein [Pedobacter sp. KBS0701]QDW24982.1 hypothetical protein FFJ24_009245 [Pedobacter sp. KBS0701]
MEHLPLSLYLLFVLTALLTLILFFRAAGFSKGLISIFSLWLIIQSILSISGFYQVTNLMPPRFILLILPPIILIVITFLTKNGKNFIARLDIGKLTILHIIRIPVELTLYWLFLHKAVPEVMTFEGRNFDILCGITAPLVYYFGYVKNVLNKKVLLAWNIICLLLLVNIVSTALLSAPFPTQQIAFSQPNIALLYFPFTLLPGLIVPIVLFSHLVSIRKLID